MATELPNGFVRFIIDGETYFQCDPEYKEQSMQWKTPASQRHKEALMTESEVKPTLISVFI